MQHDFKQATVVVTGASAGVGRATACQFAREGAAVCLLARESEGLRETEREVKSLCGRALAIPVDVADAAAVFDAAATCERTLGPIDVWVNNAMATVIAPVSDLEPEEVRRVTEVTYLGYVYGTMAALRHMRPRNRGVIVQVGSALSFRGIPLQAAYCGAKHAIRGFTDSLRSELIHERSAVAVTAVHLPAVNTPQFDWARTRMPTTPRPMPPVYSAPSVARTIVEAARHPTREYRVGRMTPLLGLANAFFPGLLDRHLADSAWEGQGTGRPVAADRRDNLHAPVDGLHRTAGSFDSEASDVFLAVSPRQIAAISLLGTALAIGVVGAAAARAASRTAHAAPRE